MTEYLIEITDIYKVKGQWFIGACQAVADGQRPLDFVGKMKICGVFPLVTEGIPYRISATETAYKNKTMLMIEKGSIPQRLERLVSLEGVLRYLLFVKRAMDKDRSEKEKKPIGIGDKRLERLAEIFNRRAILIARREPKRVAERVPGWTLEQAQVFASHLNRHQSQEKTLLELHTLCKSHLSSWQIAKVFEEKRANAPDFIRSNPYQLIEMIDGVGWHRADALAMASLKWPLSSPARITAALKEVFESEARNGHLYCSEGQLIRAARLLTRQPVEFLLAMLRSNECFIKIKDRWMLRSHHRAEVLVADYFNAALKRFQPRGELVHGLNREQSQAYHQAMTRGVFVITGGPGRGKTHTIKEIITGLDGAGRRSQILCPTGRAAARAMELTSSPAKTIHHWLHKYQGQPQTDIDTFILDECSMIDLMLLARFIRSLDEKQSLIMVGDIDQLPPVGPGKPFVDLISSGLVPVIRLEQIMRTDETGIIQAAETVNSGGEYGALELESIDDVSFRWHDLEEEEALERVLLIVQRQLEAGVAPDDIQIICARNGYKRSSAVLNLSSKSINEKLAGLLNKARGAAADGQLSIGDRVMNLRNASPRNLAESKPKSAFVANGEIGHVTEISDKTITAAFDGHRIFNFNADRSQLLPCYAATCHKFQGSEADHVIVVFDRTASAVLDRAWLYTAITRAVHTCNVIAPYSILKKAIERPSRISTRRSGLSELLQPQPLKAAI